jgi:signal transduction histidine kinase
VARLKRFARLDESAFQRADVNEGLQDALELVAPRGAGGVELVTELGSLPRLYCDARALTQLWLNLLLNARDSLGADGGRIAVSSRASAEQLVVSIRDTGSGIAPEHLGHIFDPGFTTRGVGVGTGLGLAICYQIVEQHAGSIDVRSELGQGTEVTVTLPLEPRARAESGDEVSASPRAEQVLARA